MNLTPGPSHLLSRSLMPVPQDAEQSDHSPQEDHSGHDLSLQPFSSAASPGQLPSSGRHLDDW